MKQVVQSVSGGPPRVVDVPPPSIGSTEVLVQTEASVLSPGTERSMITLARSSLLAKARARPDLVRQVMRKVQTEGLGRTVRSVRKRLEDDIPLGYSAAGTVLQVGEAVADIVPGARVATAGAGRANHAEIQAVPGLLCASLPEGVSVREAAFAPIGSIALHGLRLADVQVGARVVVLGLGLVGQLTLRIARASGYLVAGIDVAPYPVEAASEQGGLALVEAGGETTEQIIEWSRGRGADAVLITAGGKSSQAIMRAAAICRDRASIVVVGDVGLELDRRPFYERELSVRFARSNGPGRYERTYEEWGVDYPPGYVRWTEGRNLEAVLDLIAERRLQTLDLITHTFDIDDAPRAYELIETRSEPFLGVQLSYPRREVDRAVVPLRSAATDPGRGIGVVGAGNFTRSILVPALKEAGLGRFVSVASATGLSARLLAQREGFEKVAPSADDVIEDPDVSVVVIATPHDTHAELTVRALRAGKHVFCEKPLALSFAELDAVESALRETSGLLFVGFNRRWSRPVAALRDHFGTRGGPLVITYRVNAGTIPSTHWYHDRRQGGRLIGEVCHFIDTSCAIVDAPVELARAFGSGKGEALLNEDVVVTLRFADGSLATIAYATGGHARTEKERVEVLGRGRSGTIVDFSRVTLDGKVRKGKGPDKGHVTQLRAFDSALGRGDFDVEPFLRSSRATLDAAASLLRPASGDAILERMARHDPEAGGA